MSKTEHEPEYRNYLAPNGLEIDGTLETVCGRAIINGINPKTGEPEYMGETKIFWDEQRTKTRDGKILFLDTDGNAWTFDQLTQEDESEVAQ